MKIAVLSGKGGTGKTFVSVNLACVAEQAVYVDCDVEEPNGHLFLRPDGSGENSRDGPGAESRCGKMRGLPEMR